VAKGKALAVAGGVIVVDGNDVGVRVASGAALAATQAAIKKMKKMKENIVRGMRRMGYSPMVLKLIVINRP
jgi:hypothetical protein